MQRQLRILQLVGGHQILFELVTEVNINLIEAALAVAELLKVEIDVLPFCVLLVGLLLEVVEEAALRGSAGRFFDPLLVEQ